MSMQVERSLGITNIHENVFNLGEFWSLILEKENFDAALEYTKQISNEAYRTDMIVEFLSSASSQHFPNHAEIKRIVSLVQKELPSFKEDACADRVRVGLVDALRTAQDCKSALEVAQTISHPGNRNDMIKMVCHSFFCYDKSVEAFSAALKASNSIQDEDKKFHALNHIVHGARDASSEVKQVVLEQVNQQVTTMSDLSRRATLVSVNVFILPQQV